MRKAAGITLCAALGVLAAGDSLAPILAAVAQAQRPTFRAETDLIEVDVRVFDKDGRFITGLSQDDFEVLEDRKPQQIQLFSFVTTSTRSDQIEQQETGGASEKGKRDRAVAGRTYVMLLDGPAGSRDHVLRMRNVARLFLDELFGFADQMAVTYVKGKFTKYLEGREEEMIEQSFTTDRRAIEAAVDRLAPDTFSSLGVEGVIRTYKTIEEISNRLGAVSHDRKILVWIGGRVPFNPAEGATERWASEIAFAYRNAVRAADRNNVIIYVIDLLGLTTRLSQPAAISMAKGGEELKRMAALRAVADDTGGEAIVGTNDYAKRFEQIASHSNAYYLLGYQAPVAGCDGRFHTITVRVKRTGASVRARRGYFAREPTKSATQPTSQDVNSPADRVCR